MAYNEKQIMRVAFGNAVLTTAMNPDASSNNVLTLSITGARIPLGAIVTGITLFPGEALTNFSGMKNGTVQIVCGAQALGIARTASDVILDSQAHTMAPSGAPFVSVGGDLYLHLADSDGARIDMAMDVDVYVDYLYAGARDTVE